MCVYYMVMFETDYNVCCIQVIRRRSWVYGDWYVSVHADV